MILAHHMKIYTVHIRPGDAQAQERPVFVREGFSVWAFAFPFFWTLYQRLWLHAIMIAALMTALGQAHHAQLLSEAGMIVLMLVVHAVVGFHGHDWLRNRLARRGYIIADITTGDNLLRAQQRYFERYLGVA